MLIQRGKLTERVIPQKPKTRHDENINMQKIQKEMKPFIDNADLRKIEPRSCANSMKRLQNKEINT